MAEYFSSLLIRVIFQSLARQEFAMLEPETPVTSQIDSHVSARSIASKLPVLPKITEQLEQSLPSAFEREQRKDSDNPYPFGLDTPSVVDDLPDEQMKATIPTS